MEAKLLCLSMDLGMLDSRLPRCDHGRPTLGTHYSPMLIFSRNRDPPAGYRLSSVTFDPITGQPTADSDDLDAAQDIMTNDDLDDCPGDCFRPTGLWIEEANTAGDANNNRGGQRVWMTSDSTGEIWILQRASGATTGSSASRGDGIAGTEQEEQSLANSIIGLGRRGLIWCIIASLAGLLAMVSM